jgi:hypothetical protein
LGPNQEQEPVATQFPNSLKSKSGLPRAAFCRFRRCSRPKEAPPDPSACSARFSQVGDVGPRRGTRAWRHTTPAGTGPEAKKQLFGYSRQKAFPPHFRRALRRLRPPEGRPRLPLARRGPGTGWPGATSAGPASPSTPSPTRTGRAIADARGRPASSADGFPFGLAPGRKCGRLPIFKKVAARGKLFPDGGGQT